VDKSSVSRWYTQYILGVGVQGLKEGGISQTSTLFRSTSLIHVLMGGEAYKPIENHEFSRGLVHNV
jgi:hypothetical protein